MPLLSAPRSSVSMEMAEARAERCDSCRFWVESSGECRRHAPVLRTELPLATSAGTAVGVWPQTVADGWCGEWTAAEANAGASPEETKMNAVAAHLFLARLAPALDYDTVRREGLLTSLLGQLQPNVRRVVVRVNGLDGRPLNGIKAVSRELKMSHAQVQALLKAGEERLEKALRLIARNEIH